MLLDSNILIYGASGAHPGLDAILDRDDLAVAEITRIETLGFHRLSATEKQWFQLAFDRMQVIPLDRAISDQAIALRQDRRMALGDAIIAATALFYRLQLVTRNVADFRGIPTLAVLNPFDTGT